MTLVLLLLLAPSVRADKGWVDVELSIRLIEAREALVLELLRYGERHPRVKECCRRVRLLEDAVGSAPLSRSLAEVKPEPCAKRREALARAAAALRGGSRRPERAAAIDALVIHRAKLRCQSPAKPQGRSGGQLLCPGDSVAGASRRDDRIAPSFRPGTRFARQGTTR